MVRRYRIAIVDDFRNEYSFVSYARFTESVKHWEGCRVKGFRGRQTRTDCIAVFLNFKKVGEFKTRVEAAACVDRLIAGAPECLGEFESYLK